MKRLFLPLLFVCLLASCSSAKKSAGTAGNSSSGAYAKNNTDNDGSSFEKAIVIEEKSTLIGVDAEYAWIRQQYPGYKKQSQSLHHLNNRSYDIITIITKEGEEKKIHFDITKFFGKF